MARPTLTPAAWPLALGSPVVLGGGWLLSYRELVLVGLMGVLGLLAAAVATLPRPRLGVQRTVSPPRVMRREPARADVTLSAPPSRLALPGATWGLTVGLRLRDRVAGRVVERRLPRMARAASRMSLSYDLPTGRRGAVAVGPLGVARTDPLGLCRNEVRVGEVVELWVYPRVYPLAPLSSGRRRDLEGPAHERARGSMTFHSLREYVVGDDLRLVHWPSTARAGTMIVREQVDPSQPNSTVVLDTRRDAYVTGEVFEEAVDAAASLLMAAAGRRFPARLLTTGGLVVETGPGRTSGPALLDALARLEASDEGSLDGVTRRMAADRGGASLVVVTGDDGAGRAARLAKAASPLYESLAVACFVPDRVSGVGRDGARLTFTAADAAAFAALWGQVA